MMMMVMMMMMMMMMMTPSGFVYNKINFPESRSNLKGAVSATVLFLFLFTSGPETYLITKRNS